ncbi:MAG: AAA family ATPase [Acidimicrobiia bacterium]|nr:AAA family ATPase [Acidimicrobiia bacterium]
MRFGVLGPLEVTRGDGEPVDVGGRQPRVLLAALVAASGRPVTAGALVEAIWGDEPPASATGTLQSYVSRLRRALDAGGGPPLPHDDAGYRLDLEPSAVDVHRFHELATEGRAHLDAGRPAEGREALAAALALWRGPALVDLVDQGTALAQAAELEERRLTVLEERVDADLALGRHGHLVGELGALVDEHPLREGLWAKLALALYRSGRQADALRALTRAGRMLREELGIEPSRLLRDLEAAILDHDPSLDPPPVTLGIVASADRTNPFVGRESELADLVTALDEAVEEARFAVLEGEPGIGKTRLADELGAVAAGRGSLVAWGRSHECGAAPALWPWLPVLRAVASRVDGAPDLLSEVLSGEAPLLAGQGGAVQFERFDAVAGVLERAGATAPVVVLLDDVQWADTTSLELLMFLTTRLQQGVLVVATVRSLEVGRRDGVTDALGAIARRPGSRRLRLRGLSPAATGELLAALVPGPLTAELSARIHDRAEGNPFYAIELARLLDEERGTDGEVPATVRDAIRRRLTLLPPETVDLLGVAAVTGRDVDVPLVARAAGLDLGECLDQLDPAAAHRLLVEAPADAVAARFSHALVREVLLDGLTPLRRARLHLRVADAIDEAGAGRDDVEVLAEHLWRAVPLGAGDRAADALDRAAEVAVSRVAYTAAEDLLGRAARLRRAGPSGEARRAELSTLLRLLEVMQATRYFSGADRDVLARAQELAEEFGLDDVGRTLAWYEWATLSTAARVVETRPMADRFLARWGDDPRPQVRAAAHGMYGIEEWGVGRIAGAVEHLDRAAALLETSPPPDDAFELEHRLTTYAFRLFNHAAHGDHTADEALAGFDELLAAWPPVVGPAICGFAGTTAAVHARWDALDHFVRRALDADPASQFAFWGGQLLMYRGLVEAQRGEVDAGLASFVEGRTRFRSVGGRAGIASFQALMGELLARAGRVPDAAELVAGARLQTDETREGWNEVTVCIAEGVVAYHSGDKERATERLAAAVATGTEQGAHALVRRAGAVAAELPVDLPAR